MSRFRSIGWFFRKYAWQYCVAVLLAIVTVILALFTPKIFGQFIASVSEKSITQESLYQMLILLGVIYLVKYVLDVLKRITMGNLFHKLFYQIKIRFMKKLLVQDATFFSYYHSGDLMTRATNDTHMMSNVSTHLIFSIVELFVTIIFAAVFMLLVNVKMMIFAIIPLPFIFVVVVMIRPQISRNWRALRAKNSELSNKAMESVQHVKLIRAFVNEQNDFERLDKVAYECYTIERKTIYLQSVFGPTFRLFTIISQLIAFGFGSYCVINKIINVGQLIEFNMYLGIFSFPMLQLGNQIAMFSQSNIAFERMNEILQSEPIMKNIDNPLPVSEFDAFEFRNLRFSYPTGDLEILKGIDLTIINGKTLGIVGKTGSGKTTIIRQLLRQYPIIDHQLYLNGKDVNEYDISDVRKQIAYVPQEHILFSRTINNNLVIGEPEDLTEEERIIQREKAILMADFKKDFQYLPDGLETMVGEYGVTLSGGQKQRLSIARGLLKDAPILILDDSLSAVDGTTEANIIKNLRTFRKGKTNIIVAHRLSAVEHAEEIIVVEDGTIVERGNHGQLMKLGGWYHDQYNLQLMEHEHDE